jgi:poly(hydroxyalkanoate) granule-associated protein
MSHSPESLKDAAQDIWLAGLAAFTKAQREGGKVFEAMVKEGQAIQQATKTTAESALQETTQKMTALAHDMGTRATGQWDKLESIFEERVARALVRLDIPTLNDVNELKRKVAALEAQVAEHAAQKEARSQLTTAEKLKAKTSTSARKGTSQFHPTPDNPAKTRKR